MPCFHLKFSNLFKCGSWSCPRGGVASHKAARWELLSKSRGIWGCLSIADGGWELDFKVVLHCVLKIHEKQQELVNRLIKFFPQCACHEKGRIGGKEALIPPFREGPYMILNELLALCASKEVILTLFPVEGRGRRWRDLLRQPFITCISVSFCLPAANSNVVQILSSAACWNGSFLEKK